MSRWTLKSGTYSNIILMVIFFPPTVVKVQSTSPLPLSTMPFAIPPNLRSTFLISPTKSDLHWDITMLAPESMITEKQDLSKLEESSNEHHIPPLTRVGYDPWSGEIPIMRAGAMNNMIIGKKTEIHPASKHGWIIWPREQSRKSRDSRAGHCGRSWIRIKEIRFIRSDRVNNVESSPPKSGRVTSSNPILVLSGLEMAES